MNCVVAVLYLAGMDSWMTNHLVIMHSQISPFYGVYRPPGSDEFPLPASQSQVIKSDVKVSGPGTYNAIYCSSTWKVLKKISTLSRGPRSSQPRTIEQLIDLRMCPLPHIITLVHEGKISVDRYKNFDAPPSDQSLLTLKIEKELPLNMFLSSNQIFRTNKKQNEKILAWSQGYLHVFKRASLWTRWEKITKYGDENQNVLEISKFLHEFNLEKRREIPTKEMNELTLMPSVETDHSKNKNVIDKYENTKMLDDMNGISLRTKLPSEMVSNDLYLYHKMTRW
ncbi:putative effector protein [Blumeria hordei DH14]|uniref:Putative effector protein n=1 Tax=Blumeria graminis f. sp. hordei (strain DH14) TaxID=546991 RepID=N1J799_BLUG1|nr:putative effector protein [Blumeria hordei DH14]